MSDRKKNTFKRIGDMSPDNFLQIQFQDDGDIIVTCINFDPYKQELMALTAVEFCTLSNGGGRSKHTRNALMELCKAIDLDNKERPIDKIPPIRKGNQK